MSLADHAPDWIALDGAVNARAVVPRVLSCRACCYPDSPDGAVLDTGTTRLTRSVKPWESHHDDESPDEPPVVRAYMSYLRLRPDLSLIHI